MSRGTPDPAPSLLTSPTGLSPSPAGLPRAVRLSAGNRLAQSIPRHARTAVWAPPVSLAATPGIDVSFFSSGYLDVSVRRVPPARLWIHRAVAEVPSAGFPHSDTCGSKPVCGSPQFFAAYRVFLRPLVPRHPPRALSCLTFLAVPASLFPPSVALLGVLLVLTVLLFTAFSVSSSDVCLISYFAYLRFFNSGLSVFGFQGTVLQHGF